MPRPGPPRRSGARLADEERVDHLPRRARDVVLAAAGRAADELALDAGRGEGELQRALVHVAHRRPRRFGAGKPQARPVLLERGTARTRGDVDDAVLRIGALVIVRVTV